MSATRDQCREWRLLASCELDEELSELGAVRLRHHLSECADCARWVAEARSVTELLRDAELAPVERGIHLPALRRRLSRASGLVGAGASAAAAALAAVLVGFPSSTAPTPSTTSISVATVPGTSCTACTEDHIVLTAFTQALITPRPSGMNNPSVEIE